MSIKIVTLILLGVIAILLGIIVRQPNLGANTKTYLIDSWDDLRVPLETKIINPVTSRPVYTNWIGNTYAYMFAPTTLDEVHFSTQMPHGYKYGSDIYPHIHWAPGNTDTGNVVWVLNCAVAENGDVPTVNYNVTSTVAGSGVTNKVMMATFTPFVGTSLDSLSAIFTCALKRVGDFSGDTFTGNAWGIEIDFHHQKDNGGSESELIKYL